jgi:hypothetical protein
MECERHAHKSTTKLRKKDVKIQKCSIPPKLVPSLYIDFLRS